MPLRGTSQHLDVTNGDKWRQNSRKRGTVYHRSKRPLFSTFLRAVRVAARPHPQPRQRTMAAAKVLLWAEPGGAGPSRGTACRVNAAAHFQTRHSAKRTKSAFTDVSPRIVHAASGNALGMVSLLEGRFRLAPTCLFISDSCLLYTSPSPRD